MAECCTLCDKPPCDECVYPTGVEEASIPAFCHVCGRCRSKPCSGCRPPKRVTAPYQRACLECTRLPCAKCKETAVNTGYCKDCGRSLTAPCSQCTPRLFVAAEKEKAMAHRVYRNLCVSLGVRLCVMFAAMISVLLALACVCSTPLASQIMEPVFLICALTDLGFLIALAVACACVHIIIGDYDTQDDAKADIRATLRAYPLSVLMPKRTTTYTLHVVISLPKWLRRCANGKNRWTRPGRRQFLVALSQRPAE